MHVPCEVPSNRTRMANKACIRICYCCGVRIGSETHSQSNEVCVCVCVCVCARA